MVGGAGRVGGRVLTFWSTCSHRLNLCIKKKTTVNILTFTNNHCLWIHWENCFTAAAHW